MTKQSEEPQKATNSTVNQAKLRPLSQQKSHLRIWHSIRRLQYRVLVSVYLLLGVSLASLILGVVNFLAIHSLQSQVTQHQYNDLRQPQTP